MLLSLLQESVERCFVSVWELTFLRLEEDGGSISRAVSGGEDEALEVTGSSLVLKEVVLEFVGTLSLDHFDDLNALGSVTSASTVLDSHVNDGVGGIA